MMWLLVDHRTRLNRNPTARIPVRRRRRRRRAAGLEDPAQQDHLGQGQGDDGHHERQDGAHGQALGVEGLDQGQDAGGVRVERDPQDDGDGDGERIAGAGGGGEEVLGHPAVDDGADTDPDEQVGPDLADDGDDLLASHGEPVVQDRPREGSTGWPRRVVSNTNGSTQCSSRRRPMIQPAPTATISPAMT
jgi:hypothetical protein